MDEGSQDSLMSVRRSGSGKEGTPTISGNNSLNSLQGIKKKFKRAPKATTDAAQTKAAEEEERRQEKDYEVQSQLTEPLLEVSRQRLRAIKMGLRKYSNVDSRITSKELQLVFQENQLKVSGRTFQVLVETYEDSFGIDYERMWRTLVVAQSKTGRDSVLAQNRRNDLKSSRPMLTLDQKDADLQRRLQDQLLKGKGTYDLPAMRNVCQQKDENKAGTLSRNEVIKIVNQTQMPIYGALLTNLLNRCQAEENGTVSWPEVMSFLEKAHMAIGGNPTKQTSSTDTDSGTETGDSAKPSSATSKNGKHSATGPRTNGQKKEGGTPGPRRRGQGGKAPGSAGSTDTKSSDPVNRSDSALSVKSGSIPGTPTPDRSVTPSMDRIQEEVGAGHQKTNGSVSPEVTGDKSPRPGSKAKGAFKKALHLDKKDNKEPAESPSASPAPENKNITFANHIATHNGNLRKADSAATITSTDSAELKRASGSAKAASGFLSSMRTKLRPGKKKADPGSEDPEVPLLPVEHPAPAAAGRQAEGTESPVSLKCYFYDGVLKPSTPAANSLKTARSALRSRVLQSPRSAAKGLKNVEVQIKGTDVTFWPPDDFSDSSQNMDPPQQRLKLEWVYGYRGNDCRSNIYILTTGEVIYFIGTVVVIHDRIKVLQRHYREHTQEVRSLAVHSNGITVASGQGVHKDTPIAKGQACVRVWRCDTLQTTHVLGDEIFHRAVICVGFATPSAEIKTAFVEPKGTYSKDRLCAVDCIEGHSLTVWDPNTGAQIAATPLNVETVCDAGFNPTNPDVIVTVGKEHISWWNVYPEQAAIQLQHEADYGTSLKARFVTCMLHNDKGDLITGDTNGTVYVWKNGGNVVTNFIKHGHDGPVFGLLINRGTLLTAGRDGFIRSWIWSKNMDKCGEIKVPDQEGGVRMLQLHHDVLLIGTTTNSILIAPLAGTALKNPLAGVSLSKLAFTQGHFDRVMGVCTVTSPKQDTWVVTSGADGIISLIDTHRKQPIWKVMPKKTPTTCVDMLIDDEGTLVAVGSKDSIVALEILNDEEKGIYAEEMCRFKISKGRMTTVKISPDAHFIAAGDSTGCIHMLEWRSDEEGNMHWEEAGTCEGHKGSITALDWSAEKYSGVYILRSTSDAIQLLHWNPQSTACISNAEHIRNLSWASNRCLLSHSVAGVWFSKQAQDSNVVAVDVNPQKTLVVAGVESGHISLFRHPCVKQGAYSHTYKAHPHVRGLVFSRDGRKVITIGGKDSCTMQWTLV